MSRTSSRIAALLRDIPSYRADPETRAAWFDRKAAIFDEIAEQDESLATEAMESADTARREAQRLRRVGGDE